MDVISIRKNGENKYINEVLMFLAYIGFCVGGELLLISTIIAVVLIIIYNLYAKVKQNFNDKPDILKDNELPKTKIGFFLGVSTILVMIAETFITYM